MYQQPRAYFAHQPQQYQQPPAQPVQQGNYGNYGNSGNNQNRNYYENAFEMNNFDGFRGRGASNYQYPRQNGFRNYQNANQIENRNFGLGLRGRGRGGRARGLADRGGHRWNPPRGDVFHPYQGNQPIAVNPNYVLRPMPNQQQQQPIVQQPANRNRNFAHNGNIRGVVQIYDNEYRGHRGTVGGGGGGGGRNYPRGGANGFRGNNTRGNQQQNVHQATNNVAIRASINQNSFYDRTFTRNTGPITTTQYYGEYPRFLLGAGQTNQIGQDQNIILPGTSVPAVQQVASQGYYSNQGNAMQNTFSISQMGTGAQIGGAPTGGGALDEEALNRPNPVNAFGPLPLHHGDQSYFLPTPQYYPQPVIVQPNQHPDYGFVPYYPGAVFTENADFQAETPNPVQQQQDQTFTTQNDGQGQSHLTRESNVNENPHVAPDSVIPEEPIALLDSQLDSQINAVPVNSNPSNAMPDLPSTSHSETNALTGGTVDNQTIAQNGEHAQNSITQSNSSQTDGIEQSIENNNQNQIHGQECQICDVLDNSKPSDAVLASTSQSETNTLNGGDIDQNITQTQSIPSTSRQANVIEQNENKENFGTESEVGDDRPVMLENDFSTSQAEQPDPNGYPQVNDQPAMTGSNLVTNGTPQPFIASTPCHGSRYYVPTDQRYVQPVFDPNAASCSYGTVGNDSFIPGAPVPGNSGFQSEITNQIPVKQNPLPSTSQNSYDAPECSYRPRTNGRVPRVSGYPHILSQYKVSDNSVAVVPSNQLHLTPIGNSNPSSNHPFSLATSLLPYYIKPEPNSLTGGQIDQTAIATTSAQKDEQVTHQNSITKFTRQTDGIEHQEEDADNNDETQNPNGNPQVDDAAAAAEPNLVNGIAPQPFVPPITAFGGGQNYQYFTGNQQFYQPVVMQQNINSSNGYYNGHGNVYGNVNGYPMNGNGYPGPYYGPPAFRPAFGPAFGPFVPRPVGTPGNNTFGDLNAFTNFGGQQAQSPQPTGGIPSPWICARCGQGRVEHADASTMTEHDGQFD